MLVLSRKIGEELVIGKDITVKIVRIAGNRVKLGVDAPEEIPLRRGEAEPRPDRRNEGAGP